VTRSNAVVDGEIGIGTVLSDPDPFGYGRLGPYSVPGLDSNLKIGIFVTFLAQTVAM
jgi:hypothetical protein